MTNTGYLTPISSESKKQTLPSTGTEQLNSEDQRSKKQNLSFRETAEYVAARNLPFQKSKMAVMHLIREGFYTNLVYILSDQCPNPVFASAFRNAALLDLADRKEFSGSILRQRIEEVAGIRLDDPVT